MSLSIPKSKQNPNSDLKPRCYTCLSSGRNLKPMKTEEKFLLGMLCPEMFFLMGDVPYLYLMCWECEYIIVKIKRFQARVSKAQAQMKLNLQGVKSIVDSISDLKITEIVTIDLPPEVPNIIPTDQYQPTLNEIPQPLTPTLTLLKVDPEIIETEIEKEETCVGNDYDVLIPPIKITQPSSDESTDTASDSEKCDDPLRIPKEKTTKIKIKPGTVDVPQQKATKHAIISPNDKNRAQKVFIKAPKENLALRGFQEAVKVTSGVPNLVTVENVPIIVKKKAPVPTLLKTKDGITITVKDKDGASIVANDTGSNPNQIKLKLAPTCSKQEEPVLKSPILSTCPDPPKEPECEQRAGMYGDEEDEVKCTILNETGLKTFRDKKRSMRGYNGHPYKCEKCVQRFRNKKHLDQHNMKHDKSRGPSMCEVCEQRFPNKSIRNEHYKQHFIIYECLKCQYQDNDRLKTSEHIRRVHEVSVFDCKKCDAVFKTYREKRRHIINVHSTRMKSTCEQCGKTFQSLTLLKGHMAVHQRETTVCPVCNKKIRKNYFDKHMKIHDDTRMDSAYCIDCGKIFKSEKSYEWHLKTSLKHNAVEKFGIKCDHCNKYFHTKSALKDHLEEVNGIKYTCDICKKEIKNKTSLVRHIRFKHEGRKYQLKPKICEHCGKSYYSKLDLKQHINSHLGLRPYVCKDCGATFSHTGALFTHRRLVHKVKRRYEITT